MYKKEQIRKIFSSIKNRITPELATFVFIIVIGMYILLVKPIIGVADNGDFYRIISQNNLYHLSQNDEDIMFGYFNREYGIYKYANETTSTLFSTQSIFIKLAIYISKIFNNNNIFDIRFLSMILLLLHGIAAYLLVKVFTRDIKSQKFKYIIAILYIFIFCDIGYIAYFNSFYGEGIMIACFLLSVGILLYIIKFNKLNLVNLILFSIFSLLLFGSKQQLAPIGVLAAMLIIRLGSITKIKNIKIISIVIGVLFILSSALLYKSIKGDFDYMNRFHAITRGALMKGQNPEKVLKDFGIDSSYSLLKGTNFYEKVPSINPNDERLKNEFYKNYSIQSVFIYYLRNPKQFISTLKLGIENAYTIRPEAMGNYEKSEGKAYGDKSYFFSGWSSIKDTILFKTSGFMILFLIIYFSYSFKRYKKNSYTKDSNGCMFEEAYLYIFLTGFSQIVISVVGAGDADIAKHEFLYNLSFDLMIIMLVVQYLIIQEEKKIDKR